MLECGLRADLPCSLIPGLRVNTQRSMRRMLKPHTTPMGSLRGKKLNVLPLLGDGGDPAGCFALSAVGVRYAALKFPGPGSWCSLESKVGVAVHW